MLIYERENISKPDSKKTRINIVNNIYEYILHDKTDAEYMKVTICDESKSVFENFLKRFKNEIKYIEALEPEKMSQKYFKFGSSTFSLQYYFSEITKLNTNKWEALKFLIDKLRYRKRRSSSNRR